MSLLDEPVIRADSTDPIANFVALRTAAIEVFKDAVRENGKDATQDGHDVLVNSATKAIDHALSGALTEVQDNFFGFVATVEKTEHEAEVHVDFRLKAGLVQSYFDAVGS